MKNRIFITVFLKQTKHYKFEDVTIQRNPGIILGKILVLDF